MDLQLGVGGGREINNVHYTIEFILYCHIHSTEKWYLT